jgi:hypothetical protein
MSNYTKRAVLGLSIAAASIAMATPASATMYKNFANNENANICLGVAGGKYWEHHNVCTWGCLSSHPDQTWSDRPYLGTQYVQLWTGGQPFNSKTSMCLALANNGQVNPNAFIPGWAINWECSYQTTDQAWEKVYVGNDFNNHQCFYFKNKKALDTTGYIMVLTQDANVGPTNASQLYLYYWNGWAQQIWCAY